MPRQDKTRTATKADGAVALKMAQQFAAAARSELANERWNTAGLNAVHCGISAADAVLIHTAGIRSSSPEHAKVSNLLEKHVPTFKGSPRTQLVGLLGKKNTIAYEQRLLTQSEAQTLVTAANRFLAWTTKCCENTN